MEQDEEVHLYLFTNKLIDVTNQLKLAGISPRFGDHLVGMYEKIRG